MLILLTLAAVAAPPRGPTCSGPLAPGIDEPRPELSGPVRSADLVEGRFRLHWTVEGGDAPALDVDGVPLLQPIVAATADNVVRDLPAAGWTPLAADDGTGGSDAIDIYLVQIDANGYANAVTAGGDDEGASCFVRLDPGISGFGADIAASIVRHELVHCYQFRYSVDAHPWLYEASATYEQYRPSGEVGALAVPLGVLWSQRLSQPLRPMDDTGDRFEYAGFVWYKFLEEVEGISSADAWAATAGQPTWRDAMEAALAPADQSLADAFARHAMANVFACARGERGDYDPQNNAHCTATGAEVPVESSTVGASRVGEVEVTALAPWTSASFQIEGAGDANELGQIDGVALDCAATDGEVAVTVVDAMGGLAAQTRGTGVFALTAAAEGGPPVVMVTVASVGDGPADARCQVRWSARRRGGCSAAGARETWLAIMIFLPLLYRRRRS